jgi:hypothetical protein
MGLPYGVLLIQGLGSAAHCQETLRRVRHTAHIAVCCVIPLSGKHNGIRFPLRLAAVCAMRHDRADEKFKSRRQCGA